MKHRVFIEAGAEAEIRSAFRFIQKQAPLNAARWVEGMYEAIEGLATMPGAYPFARENDRFEEELRQTMYKSHRIIFTIRKESIHVLHVRHGRMDEVGGSQHE